MGNQSCYLLSQDCFSSCLRNRYFSWKNATNIQHSALENVDEYPRASVGDLIRRNRISEYIAHALSRSRSPLLLHDDFLLSDTSPLDPDFPAHNTNSWMSDATRSDASHRLYREVDPSYASCRQQGRFAGMSDSSYQLATPTSDDNCDEEEREHGRAVTGREEDGAGGGAWVAVARLSNARGSHARTLTSAVYLPSSTTTSSLTGSGLPASSLPIRRPCPPGHPLAHGEEEVDSLELARVSRGLWTGGAQAEAGQISRPRQPVTRPSVLNLCKRVGPGVGQKHCPPPPLHHRQPQTALRQTSITLDPTVLNGDEDSPAELDWDHEPGTATSLNTRSGVRKGRVHLSGHYLSSTLNDSDVSDSEKSEAGCVYRRPPISMATTGRLSDWLCKDRPSAVDSVDFATGLSVAKETRDLPDELVDSGFVGLTNSTSCASGGGGGYGGGGAYDGDSDVTLELVAR